MKFKLLICDDIRQELHGKMSLIGLYPNNEVLIIKSETPRPDGLIGLLNKICFLIVVEGLSKKVHVKAQFFQPDQSPLSEIQDMGSQNDTSLDYMNLIFDLPYFPIPAEGKYILKVFLNDVSQDFEFIIRSMPEK